MSRNPAIVLRGASGSGKTTIANALRQHFGYSKSALVVLDEGWGPVEQRFSAAARYADPRG